MNGTLPTTRKHVAWFNMAEWEEVYQQIYSDDDELQAKALDRLLLWKARNPYTTPAGVHCTVDFLQIFLRDKKEWPLVENRELPKYIERELQFMYSLAIIRFLNYLKPLAKSDAVTQIMYNVAEELNIPEWIVFIRHQSAHGHSLPSIDILRDAANFCFEWIQENYWKKETEVREDLNLARIFSRDHKAVEILKEKVEMWQSVMLYYMAGLTSLKDIPDEKVQEYIKTVKKGANSKMLPRIEKSLRVSKLFTASDANEVGQAQLWVLLDIHNYLKGTGIFCNGPSEALADVLLEGDSFLASLNFISLFNYKPDIPKLPHKFRSFWEVLLKVMESINIIPTLLEKLMQKILGENESVHRYRMAALWLKELFLGINKATQVRALEINPEEIEYFPNLKKCYTIKIPVNLINDSKVSEIGRKKLINKLEAKDKRLIKVMNLPSSVIPSRDTKMKLLNDALSRPSEWTKIFISSLLAIVDSPIPDDKKKLISLVKTYVQKPTPTPETPLKKKSIYTVDDLVELKSKEIGNEIIEIQNSDEEREEEKDNNDDSLAQMTPTSKGKWQLCKGNVGWSHCPLGRLPWQPDDSVPSMDLPDASMWQAVKKLKVNGISPRSVPGKVNKKVKFNKLAKHRFGKQLLVTTESPSKSVLETAVNALQK